ncbi:Dyp-type peroxidase [Mariniluteicoccus flavus]
MTPPDPTSRRRVLGYLGAAAAGAATAGGGVAYGLGAANRGDDRAAEARRATHRAYAPHGDHQTGIVTPTPAVTEVIALDLEPATDRAALARLMRLWTGDIESMMAGQPIPGDTAPEMAQSHVSLTVTVGFGPRVFALPGLQAQRPVGLIDIPPMVHDRLDPQWNGGDLVVIVAAEDPTSVAYASRRLVRDAESFARVRWVQQGSWRGTNSDREPVTGRNLFGQVDGTGNPQPGTQEHDDTLWARAENVPAWFVGGTQLVVRRIEMNLDTWDQITRNEQERAIGRTLDTGAPLGKEREHDELDLALTGPDGKPMIPMNAHARLSHHSQLGGRRIFRRGVNYTYPRVVDGRMVPTSGLIFLSFQADIAKQFVPMQKVLDAGDQLNDWTTAIGSAVFAMAPGWKPGEWVGQKLLR